MKIDSRLPPDHEDHLPITDITDNALKPCPFCSGKAKRITLEDDENFGGDVICCTQCQASSNVEFGFKENLVSNWNRRADLVPDPLADPAVQALVEAAQKIAGVLDRCEGLMPPETIALVECWMEAQHVRAALAAFDTTGGKDD
jgi:Lar family restriction alleviation protein